VGRGGRGDPEVTEVPSPGDEVEGEDGLLAADPHLRREAAHLKEGPAADDDSAGHEAEDRRARPVSGQRAVGQDLAEGIGAAAGLDHHPGGHEAERRVGGQGRGGRGEAPRRPPRVVVAEGDERGVHGLHPQVAAGGAEVAPRAEHEGSARAAAVVDPGFAAAEARTVLEALLPALPTARDREVVRLRFVCGLSQSEIAAAIGVSQVQVSRIIRDNLDRLRRAAARRKLQPAG
jgi:RNA polymerase sigma factor (sigma-70 family)